jgi:hypothetical protein
MVPKKSPTYVRRGAERQRGGVVPKLNSCNMRLENHPDCSLPLAATPPNLGGEFRLITDSMRKAAYLPRRQTNSPLRIAIPNRICRSVVTSSGSPASFNFIRNRVMPPFEYCR